MARLAQVAAIAALGGCEALTGISDRTLVAPGVGEPCSSQQGFIFCDDFDSETTVGQPWDWHIGQKGGALALDATDAATPPHSVQLTAPAGVAASAQLGKDVGVLSSTFGVAFDLRLDVADPAKLPETSVAQVLTGGSALSINYVVGPGDRCSLIVYDDTGATVATTSLPFPPLRTWTHLALSGDAKGLSVTEDGRTLSSGSAPSSAAPGDTRFIVGIVYIVPSQGTSGVTLELDDVVLGGG